MASPAISRSKRRGRKLDEVTPPTPEQMNHARFEVQDTHDKLPGGKQIAIGKSYRRVRMLEELNAKGFFTDKQAKALANYRNYADMSDRSVMRDSLCIPRHGGSGDGLTRTQVDAEQMTELCERAAGSLAELLRSVVVYDMRLSQWVITRSLSL